MNIDILGLLSLAGPVRLRSCLNYGPCISLSSGGISNYKLLP